MMEPTERLSGEALFLANLDWMRQAMAALCRRHNMEPADADDFVSWSTLRLIENDYAVVRQFRGESSIRTYLVVVLAMLHREYRARYWGRWRPSAAARRGGRIAVRLETLVYRDAYTLRQAITLVRTSGETALSERELLTLFATLPVRAATGRASEVPHESVETAGSASAEELVLAAEAQAERRTVETALDRALASLSREDQLIVRMRFWEGMTVADIARGLQLPQKPLYRRIDNALAALRRALETDGLSRTHARSFLHEVAA